MSRRGSVRRAGATALRRSTLLRHSLLALVGAGLLLLLVEVLNDYRNTQLAQIGILVCAVAGLSVLVGLSGQISLGNGAFMAVGAYTCALLLEHTHTHEQNLVLVAILGACVLVAAAFGAIVGLAAARLRGPYLAGATLALAAGLPSLPSYGPLSRQLGGANGLSILAPGPPRGFDLYRWQAFECGLAAILVLWACANLAHGRVGRAFRAVRDDEVAASLSGLSVARTQVLAFVVSAACAGLAGGLLAVVSLVASPLGFPVTLSLALLAAAVFGGLGSLAGAVYGSVLVALLPQWSQDLTNALAIHSEKISADLPLALYGIVLAVAMLAFPAGVQGALRTAGRAQLGALNGYRDRRVAARVDARNEDPE
ncbi:MAG TPA: branched-chain amino acid ABC transporter permease [Mycobacteriales bacterium]|nr:branched-chain amino acid ABC transporter permease [Mycobacteriales bacterium]